MREEWRNDRTSFSHCAGTFDFWANRVNFKKTKSDFMPRKTLPTPDFAPVDGQKLWGLKKSGGRGPGGSGGKISPGGEEKRVESKKGRRQFLVFLRARGGGGTSCLAGGTLIHYTTAREWETITSCVIYSDAYYSVSN